MAHDYANDDRSDSMNPNNDEYRGDEGDEGNDGEEHK